MFDLAFKGPVVITHMYGDLFEGVEELGYNMLKWLAAGGGQGLFNEMSQPLDAAVMAGWGSVFAEKIRQVRPLVATGAHHHWQR